MSILTKIISIPSFLESVQRSGIQTINKYKKMVDEHGEYTATAFVNLGCLIASYKVSYMLTGSRFVGLLTLMGVTTSLVAQTALKLIPGQAYNNPSFQKIASYVSYTGSRFVSLLTLMGVKISLVAQIALKLILNQAHNNPSFQKIVPYASYILVAAIYSSSWLLGGAGKAQLLSMSFVVLGSAFVGRQQIAFGQNLVTMLQSWDAPAQPRAIPQATQPRAQEDS